MATIRISAKARGSVAAVFAGVVVLGPLVVTTEGHAADVGLGGYTTALPSGQSGPAGPSGPATPKVTADFTGPVQTNDWWSSLIWQRDAGEPFSQTMHPHPLSMKARADGLGLGYSTSVTLSNEYAFNYLDDLRIGIVGLNSPDTRVAGYTDWTVTARWTDGTRTLDATFGHGMPFVYFQVDGGDATAEVVSGYEGVWHNSDGVLGIQSNGHYWAVFGPDGSAWSGSGAGPYSSTLGGADYLSVAILPDNSAGTLEFYRKRAYAFVTNTEVSWSYDVATASVQTTYTATTTLKEDVNGNVNAPLLALYPHQWRNLSAALSSYTYSSPRGEMKVFDGGSFQTEMRFNGILPVLPDAGGCDASQLSVFVNEDHSSRALFGGADTYYRGKGAGRAAQLVWVADQAGETVIRDAILSALKSEIQDWLDHDDGGDRLFYYDSTWHSLIGYPASHGSDSDLNDHDFHYGYWVMAAATVACFDQSWAEEANWGGMIDLLIADVANADRSDTVFPFLRSFDAYAGHNWASGHAGFPAGNNEESSSEAINFAAGVALWGAATGDTQIRDLGVFLYTQATLCAQEYWFDVRDENFPASYTYPVVGMVWSSKGAYATWWTANPEEIHGINFLPITAASLYLGHDVAYVGTNYDFMVAQNGGPESEWRGIIWEFQALADPAAAFAKFGSGAYSPENGESKAHTYHWIGNLNVLGQVDTSVTANVPTYAVFDDGTTRTHVAWNPGAAPITVLFSDGTSFVVPAGEVGLSTVVGPAVAGIVLADLNPTNAASVEYTVTFTEDVSGVDVGDFVLVEPGAASGDIASVIALSGSVYTVTIDNVAGDGDLRLDVVDDDSIQNGTSEPLGGSGTGNGDFAGQSYIVDNTAPDVPSFTGPTTTESDPPTWFWVSGGSPDGSGVYRLGYSEGVWISEDYADTSFTPGGALGTGAHTLHVQEADTAGNWSASETWTVEVVMAQDDEDDESGCGASPGRTGLPSLMLLSCCLIRAACHLRLSSSRARDTRPAALPR